jgi:heparan-alpha-glucosaminide N-acetyltransferase
MPERAQPATPSQRLRLSSLDAFRGFVMLSMASSGLGLPQVAKHFPDNPVWQFLGTQFRHSPWVGCTFWDLIYPGFVFTVGVSIVYSKARRESEQSCASIFRHGLFRSFALIVLGMLIASEPGVRDNFRLTNVLSQIGLGYLFLHLLSGWRSRSLLFVSALILVGHWAMFAAYPVPPEGFDYQAVGVPADWPHLQGFEAHWDKNTNIAADIDRIVVNWFRHEMMFLYDNGGYTTLNFIPSLATMIFGLLTGRLLRRECSARSKLLCLLAAGVFCLVGGASLANLGVCPLVKRLWTPSWTIYSTGWVLILFAAFYGVIDFAGYFQAVGPLHVVGRNSLLTYFLARFLLAANDFSLKDLLGIVFGQGLVCDPGLVWEIALPVMMASVGVWAVVTLCTYLYRRKIFIVL